MFYYLQTFGRAQVIYLAQSYIKFSVVLLILHFYFLYTLFSRKV